MKVLIFSTAYIPWVGGAEVAVKEITDRMPDQHFDLLTINLSGTEKAVEKIGNVTVYRVGSGTIGKFLFPILGFIKSQQLQNRNKYDVAWSIMASQASVAAVFFKWFNRVKLVLTVQEGDEETYLKRYVGGNEFLYRLLIRPWHRLVFKQADRVTVISNYLAQRAKANGTTAPITLVPNGVNYDLFSKPIIDKERVALTEQRGKKSGDIFLITTSRLVQKNAVGDIIDALQFLPENISVLVLGEGEEYLMLAEKIHKRGYDTGRVQLLRHVPPSVIPKFLKISDIFIRPSISEGMGVSFLEAMAAGLPVIATPVGGIVDFLTDGETGVFCRVHNPKSIAEQVQRLLNNPELREKITKNAAHMVREKYTWERIAEAMKSVFM